MKLDLSAKNVAIGIVMGVVFHIYTFAIWNSGYNDGADSVMCAVVYTQTDTQFNEIEQCQNIDVDSVYFTIRRNLPETLK